MKLAKPSSFKLPVISAAGAPLLLKDAKSFEAFFGVRYIPSLQYENWEIEGEIRKRCHKALQKGRIETHALWLGTLHNKELEAAIIPPIVVRWISQEMGYGVFTTSALPAWHFIGEYTGLVKRRGWFKTNLNRYTFMYPKQWRSPKLFIIDGEREGNFTRFINHSDTPNCESIALFWQGVFHIVFRSLRPLAAGEELSYDYGDLYWKRRKKITPS